MPRPFTPGKYQNQLLAELAASPFNRICVETAWGRAHGGGKVKYGARRLHAAHGLVTAGLLEWIDTERSVEAQGNGNNIHYSLFYYRRPAEKVFQDQLQAILDSAGKGR
jgi:hypothetical protein